VVSSLHKILLVLLLNNNKQPTSTVSVKFCALVRRHCHLQCVVSKSLRCSDLCAASSAIRSYQAFYIFTSWFHWRLTQRMRGVRATQPQWQSVDGM